MKPQCSAVKILSQMYIIVALLSQVCRYYDLLVVLVVIYCYE